MNRFDYFKRWTWSILVVGAMAFALGGCSGDDGKDGADGAPGPAGPAGPEGPAGPAGPGASVTPLESCAVCHDDGSFASAPEAHAVTGVPAIANVALADVGGNVQITYNLQIDGAPVDDFTTVSSAYIYTAADGATNFLNIPDIAVVSDGNGDYTATINGGTALAGAAARFFLRVGDGETRAVVSGDFPAAALPDIAADASCTNCHGPKGLVVHAAFGYPGMDASDCVTCHKAEIDGLGFLDFKDSWVGIVHGIHNAHDFPDGVYEYDPDQIFDTTYPTYMLNCSVCHSETTQLAAANAMTVSGENCFTCHGSMASWDFTGPPDLTFHNNIADPETADCATGCHNGTIAPATVTGFHNGLAPAFRRGPILDGEDVSVTEGAKFDWQITGIVDDGANLAIDWVATYGGVGVDPCNDTVAVDAPAFHNIDGSNLSMLRSYAQGDDFIIGMSTSAPGQPLSVNVTVDNTTCAGNVATTTIPVDTLDASIDRGIVALQGRPWVVSPLDPADAIQVRAKTPTYEWMIGSGDAPLMARRAIVDNDLCLDCHVGSMYQHGGNRIDNAGMCILCHNSASNEQNVRTATMGIDPADTYDGQVGETYELKTMLHRIHSAGEEGSPPYVIYRGRGVYAFAPDDSLLPNWPGTGEQAVFGSTIDNDGNPGSYVINHNFHAPTYPRLLNDCAACHVATLPVQPDQTQAMATTVEAGSEVWEDQVDDVLQGATTTACVTCHADGASKGHAYQNSWDPQEFEEGRQTIIDAAN